MTIDNSGHAGPVRQTVLSLPDGHTICGWFLLCDHIAVEFRSHPILGAVPICASCNNLVARIAKGRS